MGLFKSRDRLSHQELLNRSDNAETSPDQSKNSNNDSFVSSSISNADTRVSQNPAPGNIGTTTTTTTTTINSDGSIQTQVHPYNPNTDPPAESSTTYQNSSVSPPNLQSQNNSQPPFHLQAQSAQATSPSPYQNSLEAARAGFETSPPQAPRQNSTTGGRQIPERNPMRNPQLRPQITNQHQPASLVQNQQQQSPISQVNPTKTHSTTSSISRPGGTRDSIVGAIKGIHGAGEAFRGAVNGSIAKVGGDSSDMEKQRIVKEDGMRALRESGFREKAEGRLGKKNVTNGNGSLAVVNEGGIR